MPIECSWKLKTVKIVKGISNVNGPAANSYRLPAKLGKFYPYTMVFQILKAMYCPIKSSISQQSAVCSKLTGEWRMNGAMRPLDLQRDVRRPRDLLFQRELGVQAEPLVLRVQIDPLADLPDDVVAPLGRAEDEVRRRHGQNGAGRRPVVRVNLRREAEQSISEEGALKKAYGGKRAVVCPPEGRG